jgi:Fuc2NAc and GlcNAc transferase
VNLAITCISSLLISLISAKLVIYFLGKSILDHPNQRSSHSTPTPRGGGIAIYLAFICGVLIWEALHTPSHYGSLLFIGPATAVFALGLTDDIRSLGVFFRLAVQACAAIAACFYILPSEQITHPSTFIPLGFGVLFVIWMTNLYNFMDGINGIAALEGIFACLAMALIIELTQPTSSEVAPLIIMGFSIAGFLYWNFPKARLFMGDSGSPLIGFFLAFLALEKLVVAPEIFISWLIVLGVFIVDATLTLAVRIGRKQKFYHAHRTHAYQKASDKLSSHTQTSLLITAINLLWLLPWALAVAFEVIPPLMGLIAAYSPLIWAHRKLKAGY